MTATVSVTERAPGEFHVVVREGRSETSHTVTLEPAYYERLTGGSIRQVELVRRSFEFLLEREPKESILRRFELPVIERYFAEYPREIRRRLG